MPNLPAQAGKLEKLNQLIFWILIILSIIGKEEVPLVISMFGLWMIYKFKDLKTGISLFFIGLVWFVIAFFILIPKYESYRSIEFDKFLNEAQITNVDSKEFFKSNFFLHRYSQLGDSYLHIAQSLVLHPYRSISLSISNEDREALKNLLLPMVFLPILSFPIFLIALPEIAINVLSNQNIFAIDNHRISMFIPIVFFSSIYFLSKLNVKLQYMFTVLILFLSIFVSFKTNNLLLIEILKKVKVQNVFASNLLKDDYKNAISDPACIKQILVQIPDNAKFSGPNYMGAHTSLRKTNAVYPMRFYDADYIAIDVNHVSVHANEIGITEKMQDKVTQKIFDSNEYKVVDWCKSLFLFKRL